MRQRRKLHEQYDNDDNNGDVKQQGKETVTRGTVGVVMMMTTMTMVTMTTEI